MKQYYAERGFRAPNPVVLVKDKETGRSRPLKHHVFHSPDGFAWGYGGSGPSELAKDILWDCLGYRPQGILYHRFKDQFIAPLMQEAGWVIEEDTIRKWLEEQPAVQKEAVL